MAYWPNKVFDAGVVSDVTPSPLVNTVDARPCARERRCRASNAAACTSAPDRDGGGAGGGGGAGAFGELKIPPIDISL